MTDKTTSQPEEQQTAVEDASVVDVQGQVPAVEADAGPVAAVEDALAPLGAEEDEDSEDSLTFSNGVIEKIVAIAMREVPGVIGMKGSWFNRVQDVLGASDSRKGVSVEVTPDAAVRVNISVLIEYGAYAPQVFEDVKRTVVKQVSGMTGLQVAGVNLRIEDVLTPEEYAAGKASKDEPEDEGGDLAEVLEETDE
ncbi:Asp23/Gls24 family envelope stress response protein [Olsenella urininfantis]|uniref:Asp23/Gls24 family envelope stress response protein n=1 Tax=Olsenella urininfantis TaxID=1871033 RepID=UPI000987A7F1|nr:Asp23/Gls24 family envelope stress response protein [Olsenella urininfantis]